MRIQAFLILFFASLASSAQTFVVDTIPARVAWAAARVRVQAPRMGAADWSAILGDTSNYIRVRVNIPEHSEIYGRRAVATASVGGRGGEREVGVAEFDCAGDEASVRIVCDGYSARIYAGDAANVLVCRLDSLCPGPFAVQGAEPVEAWARFLPIPAPEMAPFATVDDLLAHLSASTDPREGIWRYLDRDMEDARATLAACYDLATVRRHDGGYDILYLGGGAHGWRPLQIKGRLAPTIFIGHYDLRWIDASGLPVSDESTAQFAPDASILTLSFPLHRAQLRFSRAPQTYGQRFAMSRRPPSNVWTTLCDDQPRPSNVGTTLCDVPPRPSNVGTSLCDVPPRPSNVGTSLCDDQPRPSNVGTSLCDVQPRPSNVGTSLCDVQPRPSNVGTSLCDVQPPALKYSPAARPSNVVQPPASLPMANKTNSLLLRISGRSPQSRLRRPSTPSSPI